MQPHFIHLRTHSEYSIVDGIVRIDDLLDKCQQLKMPAIAISDQNNLFAAVKFYKAAIRRGIKPLFASDLWIKENKANESLHYRLLALCQNQQGYKNLTCLISKAYFEGQHQGFVTIQREWLKQYNEGLILLSGGQYGDLGRALLANDASKIEELLEFYKTYFPDRYYIELQRLGREQEQIYCQKAVMIASERSLPIVATNDVMFLEEDDFEAHEARVCINGGYVLLDPKRPKNYTQQQYLRNVEQMQALFSDIPQALENSVEIAKRCNVTLKLGEYYLPNFPVPENKTLEEFFAEKAQQGLQKRLHQLAKTEEQFPPYQQRLQTELNVINHMGYAGYFLIVADFIHWAKNHGVAVGPGRGSGAGSLVAYVLEITDLDPLQYDLLFERFLNPERVSMPDFDIDFCMEGRDSVIEYVAQKYGQACVAQIITYGTMAAKAVVRDVGRVMGFPYGFIDKIAKLIPFELGMTLEKALAQEAALQERYNQEDEVRDVINLARKLEGITRNAGKHAGGVVIAPSPLTDFSPLYCEPGGTNSVTQFDKDDVEEVGLVKFDFLGLRTLTIIDWAVKIIHQTRSAKNVNINIHQIPLDDPKTFDLLQACKTTAVFQLESRGMKDLIKRLQPDTFEDIIALVALFRPGPLQSGMVDDFIDRKQGRAEVRYLHPKCEPILKTTYGVILYQEQVMQIAQELAGYTLGGADLLRRAMGKKKPEEMANQRKIFTEGAVARGVEEKIATEIFDLMEKFAGYGFNKSHSAAYALVAYQTAWLKAHYPSEFMAAVLSSDLDNTDKIVIFLEDCKAMQINVLPPDINSGNYRFTVDNDGNIIYGLGAIKGVGETAIQTFVEARQEQGQFKDFFSMIKAIDIKKINKRVLEALVGSGACDSFAIERSCLFAAIAPALKLAEQAAQSRNSGQISLFDRLDHVEQRCEYPKIPAWSERQRLQHEKESLGFYLTGHPFDRYRKEFSNILTSSLAKLSLQYQQVTVGGCISALRITTTKRGDRIAFITLEDGTGQVEIAIFSDVLMEYRELVVKDQLVIVQGDLSVDEYSGGFRMSCQQIMTIEYARQYYGKYLLLHLDKTILQQDFTSALAKIIKQFRVANALPIYFAYRTEDATARLQCGEQWCVNVTDELLEQLQEYLGNDRIEIVF